MLAFILKSSLWCINAFLNVLLLVYPFRRRVGLLFDRVTNCSLHYFAVCCVAVEKIVCNSWLFKYPVMAQVVFDFFNAVIRQIKGKLSSCNSFYCLVKGQLRMYCLSIASTVVCAYMARVKSFLVISNGLAASLGIKPEAGEKPLFRGRDCFSQTVTPR